MGVKYPSQVYLESHMANHVNLHLSGDPVVKEATSCQLEREGGWKRKSSTAVQCQAMLSQLSNDMAIPTAENCPNPVTRRLQKAKVMKAANNIIKQLYFEDANAKADKHKWRGEFARIVAEEEKDVCWQSLIFAVPKGVMACMARPSTNCLASPDNLAKWKKIVDPKCPLCSISPCALGQR